MISFIQYKAGATLYRDSKVTLTIRKNYIEYVFDLGYGRYGVINPEDSEIKQLAGTFDPIDLV